MKYYIIRIANIFENSKMTDIYTQPLYKHTNYLKCSYDIVIKIQFVQKKY